MATEPAEEEPGFDLVMPFVTVASKGGPHDDVSYVDGWAMGTLDARLEAQETNPAPIYEDTIRADNVPQADRIAMKHGYTAHFVDGPDGWTFMTLRRNEVFGG